MRTRDKRDHKKFTGRVITWVSSCVDRRKPYQVRVVGVNYHIGVTFVNVDDPNDFFTCINGPLTPEGKDKLKIPGKLKQYEKEFQYVLDTLRSGAVYDVDIKKKVTGYRGIASGIMASCPYGI